MSSQPFVPFLSGSDPPNIHDMLIRIDERVRDGCRKNWIGSRKTYGLEHALEVDIARRTGVVERLCRGQETQRVDVRGPLSERKAGTRAKCLGEAVPVIRTEALAHRLGNLPRAYDLSLAVDLRRIDGRCVGFDALVVGLFAEFAGISISRRGVRRCRYRIICETA